MRFKLTLTIKNDAQGNTLPISYQYELSAAINRLLTAEQNVYQGWLQSNNLTPEDNQQQKVYALSNLYVPRILVEGDRLTIKAPRVQCWISFFPEVGTEEFVRRCLTGQELLLGDRLSRVLFVVDGIDVVSPVEFAETMEYMSLSPVVVLGMRPNRRIEYLAPDNPVFAQFMIEELIERYERLKKHPYEGSRAFQFDVLYPPKRKGVMVRRFTPQEQRVVGYMLKFRITMSPELQQLAYETGIGDKIGMGFGYIELLNKKA